MDFSFQLRDKIAFYWKYFISKTLLLWFEVRRPRFKMFLYEMFYSAMKFIDHSSLLPSPFDDSVIETKFGIFKIRPHTTDMSTASPAFERRDMDYLLNLLFELKKEDKKILFLDIGADIGTFTVTVGNQFKTYDRLSIVAFEPVASSRALLEENIKMNGLNDKVKTYQFALFNEDNKEIEFHFNPCAPGSSGIHLSCSALNIQKVVTKTLDSVLYGTLNAYDAVIIKIDVEGVETEVFEGGEKVLYSGKDVFLLVEDFVNSAIVRYLERIDARFICKLTPYNSWWHIHKIEGIMHLNETTGIS